MAVRMTPRKVAPGKVASEFEESAQIRDPAKWHSMGHDVPWCEMFIVLFLFICGSRCFLQAGQGWHIHIAEGNLLDFGPTENVHIFHQSVEDGSFLELLYFLKDTSYIPFDVNWLGDFCGLSRTEYMVKRALCNLRSNSVFRHHSHLVPQTRNNEARN